MILGETQNGGIFRTTNGGSSWNAAMSGINTGENVTWVAPIIAHPDNSGTFYVARQTIYRSVNDGGNGALSPEMLMVPVQFGN